MYLVMKMKYHAVFILQNKLLKNILIYYYYWNLKIPTVLIKEIDRFMTNKTKYHGKKHFCWYCLQCFSSSRVLECHVKNCLVINHKNQFCFLKEMNALICKILKY